MVENTCALMGASFSKWGGSFFPVKSSVYIWFHLGYSLSLVKAINLSRYCSSL